ncbi:MAG: LPS export ABC transporter ATP-binding protein [Armatimonadetes bacterium]|jgi:lipopolysaccharide export system ATP-binding protein|nr:LPS export ABC transporter ATP-binding protein [Armatimonadota bacterium]MDI9586952.1 LPS export ABC transporter ATP-binding protein [Acidobacteriota bacterium]
MPLEAIDLKKSYRGREVVRGVSFTVNRGEIVGLLGPNGAGKTTSFYMTLGLVQADSGRVLLEGEDLNGLPMHSRCRKGIGYLAQEPSVFRKLTVRENLLLILELQGLPRAEQFDRADTLLEKLGLSALANSKGMVLSGGEQRRVEIARTLCTNPSYILLDEPFTGVDPIAIEDIQNIVRGLKDEDTGILITDHNVRETLGITDRAYIISDGLIRTQGSAADLPHDPIARKYYLGDRFRM